MISQIFERTRIGSPHFPNRSASGAVFWEILSRTWPDPEVDFQPINKQVHKGLGRQHSRTDKRRLESTSLTSGEGDPGHELRSGQAGGVQEAGDLGATPPRGQPPQALLASSYLQGKTGFRRGRWCKGHRGQMRAGGAGRKRVGGGVLRSSVAWGRLAVHSHYTAVLTESRLERSCVHTKLNCKRTRGRTKV